MDQGGEFTEGQQRTIERNEQQIAQLMESIGDQVRPSSARSFVRSFERVVDPYDVCQSNVCPSSVTSPTHGWIAVGPGLLACLFLVCFPVCPFRSVFLRPAPLLALLLPCSWIPLTR